MSQSPSPPRPNASVYQLDHQQLNDIVLPRLRRMADSYELLERERERRFGRDDPPSYRSPTPPPDDVNSYPPLWSQEYRDSMNVRLDELLNEPLSDEELRKMQHAFESNTAAYHPGLRYNEEVKQEQWYLRRAQAHDRALKCLLKGRVGMRRQKILARHLIKQRWQQFGVWNPEWGIPGRANEGPEDDTADWKWAWQGDTPARGTPVTDDGAYIAHHPNSRAVDLRKGLLRGERGPPPPRPDLGSNPTKSAAEAFITSRPWYTFNLDVQEEEIRQRRFETADNALAGFHGHKSLETSAEKFVREWWDVDGFENPPWIWKWKHESPEPDRRNRDYSNLDLTPSEFDALDEMPLTCTSPSSSGDDSPGYICCDPAWNGTLPEDEPSTAQSLRIFGANNQASAAPTGIFGTLNQAPTQGRLFGANNETTAPRGLFGADNQADVQALIARERLSGRRNLHDEYIQPPPPWRPEPVQLPSSVPNQETPRRGRPRGRRARPAAPAAGDAQRDVVEPPGPRRSSRVAHRVQQQQQQESPAPAPEPVPRTRRRTAGTAGRGETASKATRARRDTREASPAEAAAVAAVAAGPKRGRGRPPKGAAATQASKPQGVVKKKGRPLKTAAATEETAPRQAVRKAVGRPPRKAGAARAQEPRDGLVEKAGRPSRPQEVVKKPGRPRKAASATAASKPQGVTKTRGRPRRTAAAAAASKPQDAVKRRGRPLKKG